MGPSPAEDKQGLLSCRPRDMGNAKQQNAATQEVGQNINQVSDASIETERMAKDTLGAAA